MIDLRPIKLTQELARISAQSLHVTALAFGVEGIEREAGLTRAARAREDDELPLWDGQVIDRQVVLARAANDDEIGLAGAMRRRARTPSRGRRAGHAVA